MKRMLNQKGITLMELMISIATSTVIAYAIFTGMRVAQAQMDTASVSMTVQTSAREGLYRMIQEIRNSAPTRITIANDENSITFNVPDPDDAVTSGYAVKWPGHSITYDLQGDQIIRTNNTTGQEAVLANDVTNIDFEGNAAQPTMVTVGMTVQRNLVNERAIPVTVTGQAKIRNT